MPVAERITGPDGAVATPLDEDAVRAAAHQLWDAGVEAIAVCFLFSFLNPVHERRAAEIVRAACPDAFVSVSHEVIAQYREYERFSTTCLNAYVGPKTAGYLARLQDSLAEDGVKSALHVMQSNGGCATVSGAAERPVSLLMSGPVGGLIGGIWCGALAGHKNVISLDVGGTSADIGVAPDGQMQVRHLLDTRIGDYHAMVPMADVDTIGAGGGSIAYVDPGGQFQVGPRSAGADPGPCCYDRGGTEPTATDCEVVLGRIDPANFLGGRLPLNSELSRRAVEDRLARPLGMSVEDAATGAIKILNHNMIQAIEINSVRKGYDPRDFALVAFGGAGPLFACEIAAELSIPTVVVPVYPGLTSALGLLTTDVSYDFSTTRLQLLSDADLDRIATDYAALEAMARRQLEADGTPGERMALLRFADCRYAGQGYELRAAAPADAIEDAFRSALRRSFDDAHRRAYGSTFPDKDVQVVNLRVVGIGRIPDVRPREIDTGGGAPPATAMTGCRAVTFEFDGQASAVDTPHYDRLALQAGNRVDGPAIITQLDSTTVVPPGLTAAVDRYGNLPISLEE